jgi:hypothetical protein
MADFTKEDISILFSKAKVDWLKQTEMSIKVIGRMENLMEKEYIMIRNQASFKKVYGRMDSLKVNSLMDVQRNLKLCLRTKKFQLNFLIIL